MEQTFLEQEYLRTIYNLKKKVEISRGTDTTGMSEYLKGLHRGAEYNATQLLIEMQSKVITSIYGYDEFNYEED